MNKKAPICCDASWGFLLSFQSTVNKIQLQNLRHTYQNSKLTNRVSLSFFTKGRMTMLKISISRVLFGFLMTSLLAGCQSVPIHETISSETTDAFLAQFTAKNEATQKDWKQMVRKRTQTGEKMEGEVVSWVQPLNKKDSCKIYMGGVVEKGGIPLWENPDSRFYWDGDCRNGYAYGIGREFIVIRGEVASSLGDYSGEQKEPTYYLDVNYDRKVIHFPGKSHPYYADLAYTVQTSPNGKEAITINQTLLDLSEDRFYSKFSEIGGDTFKKATQLPNKNKYVMEYSVNPTESYSHYFTLNDKNENTGYGIGINDNGVAKNVRHIQYLNHTNAVDVILPDSYLNHWRELDGKTNSKLAMSDKLIQESYVAINKYKRRICKDSVQVDFIDNEIYGRICLKNGELEPYTALIEDLQAQQEKRHVKAREDIAVRRQQSMNQAIAQSQADDVAFSNAINNFSNGMYNFSQDAYRLNQNQAQLTNSLINSSPPPSVNFGRPEVQTNCFSVANMVRCRTQ